MNYCANWKQDGQFKKWHMKHNRTEDNVKLERGQRETWQKITWSNKEDNIRQPEAIQRQPEARQKTPYRGQLKYKSEDKATKYARQFKIMEKTIPNKTQDKPIQINTKDNQIKIKK